MAASRLAYTKARRLNVLAMSDQARLAERMVNEARSAQPGTLPARRANQRHLESLAHDASIGHLGARTDGRTGTLISITSTTIKAS